MSYKQTIVQPPVQSGPFAFLERLPELQGLPKAEINHLLSQSALLKFQEGEIVFHQGGKADYFYFVLTGRVSMGACTKAGRESLNCIAHSKDLFCCLPALDANPYPATATADSPSTVLQIPIAVFQTVCLKYPHIYQKFVVRVCSKLREIEQRHSQRMDTAMTKIAALLAGLYKQKGPLIDITRAEIAQLVGVTTETAIRTISHMMKDKILSGRRSALFITDADHLFQLAEITH